MTDEGRQQDLELVAACLAGDEAALTRLESDVIGAVGPTIARIDSSPAFGDEVRQRLRIKLLVGEGGRRPGLASYEGRGSLSSWVHVVAARIAISLKRGDARRKEAAEPDLDDGPFDLEDPELAHIRGAYRNEFHEAFREAVGTLSPRERTILRLRYLDQVNIDGIGRIYRVHRATVARWIAAAREKIAEETRRAMAARLAVTSSQLDSLIRLVRSDLELSVSLLLSDDEDDRQAD